MRNYQTNYKSIGGKSVQKGDKLSREYEMYRKMWKECPMTGVVPDFPLNIDLELTNACNLQCPHCARTQKNWGDDTVGFIDEEVARKVIDEIKKENGCSMKFSLRGEPLLHNQLLLFLELCKNSNLVDYYFNTNGVLLSDDLSRRLVELRLPRISISVGGWDTESFSRCQVGADLKTVRGNIIRLRNIRNKMLSQYPKIRVQAVLLDELKPHINEFSSMWEGIADEVGLIDFREETGEQSYRGLINADFRCNYLWQRLVVLWDGTVLPCLFHGVKCAQDIVLGNIKDKNLKEMWKGEKINILRKEHLAGLSNKNPCCNNCSHRYSEIIKY